MAKTQTFGDKSKKKAGAEFINVKVLRWNEDAIRGTLRYSEKFVRVKDASEIDKIN